MNRGNTSFPIAFHVIWRIIHLLLDRDDGAISICEIKYSGSAYRLEKSDALNLDNKISTTLPTVGILNVIPHEFNSIYAIFLCR